VGKAGKGMTEGKAGKKRRLADTRRRKSLRLSSQGAAAKRFGLVGTTNEKGGEQGITFSAEGVARKKTKRGTSSMVKGDKQHVISRGEKKTYPFCKEKKRRNAGFIKTKSLTWRQVSFRKAYLD